MSVNCELCGHELTRKEEGGRDPLCLKCRDKNIVSLTLQNPTLTDLLEAFSKLCASGHLKLDAKVRLIDSDYGENALERITVRREDGVVILHF